MKTLFLIFTLLLSGQVLAKNISIQVNGMVCAFCAQGIEKKFGQETSVETINVDLDAHLVSLKLKDGQDIADERIKNLLQDAGYSVQKIVRE